MWSFFGYFQEKASSALGCIVKVAKHYGKKRDFFDFFSTVGGQLLSNTVTFQVLIQHNAQTQQPPFVLRSLHATR